MGRRGWRNLFFLFLFSEEPAEIISERKSCLFAGFYKGIIDCRVLYSLHTSEEQAVLSLDSDWSYRSFRRHIVYGVFSVIPIGEDLIPEVLQIVKGLAHKFTSALIRICKQIIKLCSYLLDDFHRSLIVFSAVNLVFGKFLSAVISSMPYNFAISLRKILALSLA